MFRQVLVICVGNICRSPVAEEILRKLSLADKVVSAGIEGLSGERAHPYAVEVSKENGVDLSHHIAQKVQVNHIKDADLILCMEEEHISAITSIYPYASGKTFLLGHWENKKEIHDPYQKPKEAFITMFNHVELSAMEWAKKLQA